jgi:hypothetical protein
MSNLLDFHLSIGFSKLVICGGVIAGSAGRSATDTCEVISLESSATTCKNLPNISTEIFAPVGGLGFNENPIVCGGAQKDNYSNRCFSLNNNEWVLVESMSSERGYAAGRNLEDGNYLVIGGISDSGFFLETAEMLTAQGWDSKVPPLPVTLIYHCMVTINSTTVMIIGGQQSSGNPEWTFYFNFGNERWTWGPELKQGRTGHSCGRIKKDEDSQEMSIIVAGGEDGRPLSSVEILDEGSEEWRTGPNLPLSILWSQMVEDQSGGVILIGGSSDFNSSMDTLFHLSHGGQDAVWTQMEQKLKIGREFHTGFLVPDNIVDCS